nr:class I SAM-dependent methyltransferase [Methylobacterium sp. NI91]
MDGATKRLVEGLYPQSLEVCEISGDSWSDMFRWKSFTRKHYPEFDICKDEFEEKYDLIIAEQVFEHVRHPWEAAKNIYKGLKPGGHFLISTPFLFHLHPTPLDCWRWTPQGMGFMLEDAGFRPLDIVVDSWGNYDAFLRHAMIGEAPVYDGSQPIHNIEHIPIMVWALAKKSSA